MWRIIHRVLTFCLPPCVHLSMKTHTHSRLGFIMNSIGDYDKAITCEETYLEICRERRDTEGMASHLCSYDL